MGPSSRLVGCCVSGARTHVGFNGLPSSAHDSAARVDTHHSFRRSAQGWTIAGAADAVEAIRFLLDRIAGLFLLMGLLHAATLMALPVMGHVHGTIVREHARAEVELPHADSFPDTRRHPLHVNVRLGEPGRRGDDAVIWVKGTAGDVDNRGGYVND